MRNDFTNRPLKLLFIDDNEADLRPVLKLVKEEDDLCHRQADSVKKAKNLIRSMQPDMVILDLKLLPQESDGEISGKEIEDLIWRNHFCPIVIYSGFADVYERSDTDRRRAHPLHKIVVKGKDSEEQVMEAIRSFRPYARAIQQVVMDVRSARHEALLHVVPHVLKETPDKDVGQSVENVKLTVKRRIASMMDTPLSGNTLLAAKTQYLIPPIDENIVLGDILQEKNTDSNSPASFRVVLTPSCDMLTSETRKAKVNNVLVAKCDSIKTLLKNAPGSTKRGRIKPSVLTQGFLGSMIPFPRFPQHIPSMGADMKNLELVPLAQIGAKDSEKQYWRIASIDSPFRELISWVYLQVAGRPGLPNRDFESWAKEIDSEV